MKILGINPKDYYTGWPVQSDFGRELYRSPALTFPVLSRLLPPGRHEMRFFEGFFEPIRMKDYNELLKWPDAVGLNIASSYGSINYAILIKQIRRLNPGAFIMAGGHHSNMYPKRWLDLGVDLVVKGEAELTFASIVEEIAGARQFDRVPGVIFKRDGEYVETDSLPQIETLDESPAPDLDLINFDIYPCLLDNKGGYVGSLESSRGCSFRCRFCAVPVYWQGTQRYKSVGRVMDEVRELHNRKVRQINILDDGFGNDQDYLEELLDAFCGYGDELNWVSFLRADTVLKKPELVDRLGRAGMKAGLLGFEAISDDVLKKCMGKGMRLQPTLKDYQEIYRRFRKNGIMVIGVFISGHPEIGEGQDTSYFDARTICDDPRMADYMPFPGTAGWDELTAKYDIKDMFFHDAKLPVFPELSINAVMFNAMNILDLPRSLRMLTGPSHYRKYLLWSHRRLWSKLFRVNRMKLRDYLLFRRKDMESDLKQEKLFGRYLDPDYLEWLEGLEDKVWF
jgi:radical SAM superfamily enzyme YgiQ (UPF0313 family)